MSSKDLTKFFINKYEKMEEELKYLREENEWLSTNRAAAAPIDGVCSLCLPFIGDDTLYKYSLETLESITLCDLLGKYRTQLEDFISSYKMDSFRYLINCDSVDVYLAVDKKGNSVKLSRTSSQLSKEIQSTRCCYVLPNRERVAIEPMAKSVLADIESYIEDRYSEDEKEALLEQ